jgi:hypothetical protein
MNKSINNNKLILGFAILLIIIVLGAAIYLFYFNEQEKIIEETDTTFEIDDRISPDLNQGITVEIDRIRHRGIIDKMLIRGSSWKNKPLFYYISEIDGLEYISKDVHAPGGADNEFLFNDWDTMAQDNRVQKDIPEEQETSNIKLTIVERVSSGLLGLRTNDIERDTIRLTYDYRTGRWTGDDYFNDDDGYGHYVGDTFEVWFNVYQTDFDADGIPYWTEVNIIHSDPRSDDTILDPDKDGIPTAWEWKWGYDPNSWDDHRNLDPDIDGIQNIEEYQTRKYFANPFAQDIYIEVDWMEKAGFFDIEHEFYQESGQIMIERFCENGINLYIDDGWPGGPINGGGQILTHYETISQDSGVMKQFYDHYFSDDRKGTFRYLIVGHNAGFCIPSEFNRYDTMVVDSSPFKSYLRRYAYTPRTQRIVLAAATLHELAHSLGIAPWTFQGNDNFTFANGRAARQHYDDTWGDYYSVNNYYHIWDKNLVDYSDGSNGPPYDQNDWQHFYLPTFYIDSNAMEDPDIEAPGTDRLNNESPEPTNDEDWIYEINLTEKYENQIKDMCFVENVNCEVRLYIKSNNNNANKNIRIYAKPDVYPTFAIWSLISEGEINQNETLWFYSVFDIIEDVRSQI